MNPPPLNETEADERRHLQRVTETIRAEAETLRGQVTARHAEMQELKNYLQENKADMDHAEKASVRQSVDLMSNIGGHGAARSERLARLLDSPYFGRIDVRDEGHRDVRPVYIGIHGFYDAETDRHLVHDWRAPVSSMFYEYELGDARYDAPQGRRECELVRKRQYRIEARELKFMLETSLNIQDDVLQEELSRASDDKMKNIVATIQRDQNAIIRNERSETLIIQGAAGSGKTSIALHRIAFLLYRYRDSIRSDEILIISPNKVFAHYISQVLPELGEEMIGQTTMEALASELLDHKVKLQTFSEQIATLLAGDDEAYAERVRFKATGEFLQKIRQYARHVRAGNVQAKDVQVGLFKLSADWIEGQFRRRARLPAAQQVTEVLREIADYMQTHHRKDIAGKERTRLRGELKAMLTSTTLKAMYKNFYDWIDRPEMFKPLKGGKYEHGDLFPLVYLKILTGGVSAEGRIKHVVIDEMQDYTPVQYEVIASLYDCNKTILGDHNQSVSPLSSSSAEEIREVLLGADCCYMNQSYRSTLEITELAQRISLNPNLVPVERHGDQPSLVRCRSDREELTSVRREVDEFLDSDDVTLGILCKTQRRAERLHRKLRESYPGVRLLDARSTTFTRGIMVATAYMAKGLEFDRIVVPFCSDAEYRTEMDRHMLYVACTRAMHKLTLTYTGEPSRFLQPAMRDGAVSVRPPRDYSSAS